MFARCNLLQLAVSGSVAMATFFAAVHPSVARTPLRGDGTPPQSVNGVPLADYLGSPEYWSQLKQFTVKFEKALGPCPNAELNRRFKAVPSKQAYKVPGVGTPPQWIELLKIEGCKTPFQRNIVVFLIEGKPRFMPVLHGTSKADPFLQVDVMKLLLPAARAQASKSNCAHANNVRILGTKLTREQLTNRGMSWSETWRVADCHGTHDYQVKFVPSAQGGTTFHLTSL